jgi:hypothetical protein
MTFLLSCFIAFHSRGRLTCYSVETQAKERDESDYLEAVLAVMRRKQKERQLSDENERKRMEARIREDMETLRREWESAIDHQIDEAHEAYEVRVGRRGRCHLFPTCHLFWRATCHLWRFVSGCDVGGAHNGLFLEWRWFQAGRRARHNQQERLEKEQLSQADDMVAKAKAEMEAMMAELRA